MRIHGIVYALNGYTPRNAWMQDGLVKYNSYMFHSMNHDFIPDYIFLSNNPKSKSEFQEYFRAVQIPFETDYIFIDSIEHPLFGYEPMPINEYIYIYSKKDIQINNQLIFYTGITLFVLIQCLFIYKGIETSPFFNYGMFSESATKTHKKYYIKIDNKDISQ